MVQLAALLAFIGAIILCPGCLSTANLALDRPEYFGGATQALSVCTQCAGEGLGLAEPAPCLGEPLNAGGRVIVFSLCAVDTPLSFVLDAVTLPYVLYRRWAGPEFSGSGLEEFTPSAK